MDCRVRKRPAPRCPSHKTGHELTYQEQGAVLSVLYALSPKITPLSTMKGQKERNKVPATPVGRKVRTPLHGRQESAKILPLYCHALGEDHPTFCSTRLRPTRNPWLAFTVPA